MAGKPKPSDTPKPKKKMGRPSRYTPELGTLMMKRLGAGESLNRICKDLNLDRSLVHGWAGDPAHDFYLKYNRGRDMQADTYADQIIEISDDASLDWQERAARDGGTMLVTDHEHIKRSQLRVDARKWIAARLKPRKYGDKVEVETKDVTPQLTSMPSAQLLGLLQVSVPVNALPERKEGSDDE